MNWAWMWYIKAVSLYLNAAAVNLMRDWLQVVLSTPVLLICVCDGRQRRATHDVSYLIHCVRICRLI